MYRFYMFLAIIAFVLVPGTFSKAAKFAFDGEGGQRSYNFVPPSDERINPDPNPCFTYGYQNLIKCLDEDDFEILRQALIENIGIPVYTIAPDSVYVDFNEARGSQTGQLYFTTSFRGARTYNRHLTDTYGLHARESHCWVYIEYNAPNRMFFFDIDQCPLAGIFPQNNPSLVRVNRGFIHQVFGGLEVVATGFIPLD